MARRMMRRFTPKKKHTWLYIGLAVVVFVFWTPIKAMFTSITSKISSGTSTGV